MKKPIDLSAIPSFASLTAAECEELRAATVEENVPAGQVLIEGNTCHEAVYILLEGRVCVEKPGTSSRQGAYITEMTAGDIVGTYGLIGRVKATARVTALDNCRLLRLNYSALQDKLSETVRGKLQEIFCHRVTDDLNQMNLRLVEELQRKFNLVQEKLTHAYFLIRVNASKFAQRY